MSGSIKRIDRDPDGVYSAYFSGAGGTSLALLLFIGGRISGADESGSTFDGSYELQPTGDALDGTVTFSLAPGAGSITGFPSGEEGLHYDVPISFPIPIPEDHVFRFETPVGPINGKFFKLRDL